MMPQHTHRGTASIGAMDLLVVLVLILASFYLFSHWVWRPASPDERDYLAWGLKIYREGVYETLEGRPVTGVPPLHPHLLAWAFRLFGPSLDAAQSVSLVFGCLCIALVYLFGRCLWNRRVGLIAAAILMTSAKGEFWRYANRVLSDIHLTFFLLLMLFGLCLYHRHGKWWMGALSGVGLGLGLLTKEFILIAMPLGAAVFLIRRGRWRHRLLNMALAGAIAGVIVLPWVLHVSSLGRLPWARGGQERVRAVIESERSKGMRPAHELWEMVRFYDRPSSIAQYLFLGSILYGIWRAGRRRSAPEIILAAAILAWFATFAVFKALPLNLRRLIPLLPPFSLLLAVLFDDIWLMRGRLGARRPAGKAWATGVMSLLFCFFLVQNLWPQKILRGFRPFGVLTTERKPYLEAETRSALECIPPGATVLSNYASLVYFYAAGAHPVRTLPTTLGKRKRLWMEKDPTTYRPERPEEVIYDYRYRERRMLMDERALLNATRESGASHLVFLRTGHPRYAPRPLERYFKGHPNAFKAICEDNRYAVYRILPGSVP